MSTIITKRQFPNYRKYEMELAGRPLTLEVGKLAELANAAVMVGYGDTRVLVCATASPRPRDGIDFFPLSVDFEEKLYSVGRIPGSFNRREGRPGEKGILTSRVIDRPIRPLFPYDFRNDVSIMATVMAVDHDCSPEIAALIGTSAALVPLTIAAAPMISRLVESSLREVDKGLIEAALSMGATSMQIIRKVLLPEALPGIIAGITIALVSLVGASAMAGAIGGGGLGDLAIRYGYQRFMPEIMYSVVVILIVFVQAMQSLGDWTVRKVSHR